jgi:serine/threonine protein kinase
MENLKHIFKCVINALVYLHSLSIAHRDIKLDNIVISNDLEMVKFIDFGLCIDLSKI